MTHNLNSMMYHGETPWHGLGTKVAAAATSAEAITAAGLGWSVNKVPLFRQDRPQGPAVDAFATVRMDTADTLGIVGDVYRPLQNREAFSFFDAVVGEKAAMYHTAGALGLGETVWILAKLPGYIRVVGEDVSEKFLLLTNRHDGRGAVRVQFTPIRVVCQNTLNIALGSAVKAFKARHAGNLGAKIQDVREYLGIIDAKTELFETAARRLAAVQLTTEAWAAYVEKTGVIPPAGADGKPSDRSFAIMEEVSALFENGMRANLPGARRTAWGAFNAVVEYVDYHRTTRNDKRAESLLFGSGAAIKQAAWDAAVEIAK